MSKDNSGPAFPGTEENGLNNGCPGMTLRDYFAAKAMQGLLANPAVMEFSNAVLDANPQTTRAEWLADQSFGFADAMMKAREA